MDFVKMQGLGNDFVVIEGPADPSRQDVVSWCDRRRGIGADGVLEVTPLDDARVRMRYWNADGGAAEMCGNGLRCVARYAVDKGFVESQDFVVETAVGSLPVHVNLDGTVRAFIGRAQLGEELAVAGVNLHTVDMGNPHAIQWVEDPDDADVGGVGPLVETAEVFPNDTNVEFASISAPDTIRLRVWERGVGETLACGTGAAATAFLAHQLGKVGRSVAMELNGGTLRVDLTDDGVWIEGPAETVFRGRLY